MKRPIAVKGSEGDETTCPGPSVYQPIMGGGGKEGDTVLPLRQLGGQKETGLSATWGESKETEFLGGVGRGEVEIRVYLS